MVNATSQQQGLVEELANLRGQGERAPGAGMAGVAPGPWMAAYAASKAYVLSFSQALREELKRTGIKVSVLGQGTVQRP